MSDASNESCSDETFSDELNYEEQPVEVNKVIFDTKKVYKYTDKFNFKVKITTNKDVEEVLVNILYFGAYGGEDDEQLLGSALVGPCKAGEHEFDIEADDFIQLHKIPIKGLFGLNTVLLQFKIDDYEIVRYAFITNVVYPGIRTEDLTGEDVVDDDDQIEDDDIEIISEDGDDESNEEVAVENIDMSTPIKENEDEFEYLDKKLLKSKIEFKFMENPIVQVFDVIERDEPVDRDEPQVEEVKKVKSE